MKLTLPIFILFLSSFISCRQSQEGAIVPQEAFFQENQDQEFESWKYWDISKRGRYYMATFECDTSEFPKTLIFWKDDSTSVRFSLNYFDPKQESVPMSEIYNVESLTQSIVDSLRFDFCLSDLREHINFVYKYNLEYVSCKKKPNRIYFRADSLDILYLFSPIDSGFTIYNTAYNPHWYYQKEK